jgi:hypothetical protein
VPECNPDQKCSQPYIPEWLNAENGAESEREIDQQEIAIGHLGIDQRTAVLAVGQPE